MQVYVIMLYQNKEILSDCNNYVQRYIFFQHHFARVALERLQTLAERVYPESQCGFRAERYTIDMIFSLRQQMTEYIIFLILCRKAACPKTSYMESSPQDPG